MVQHHVLPSLRVCLVVAFALLQEAASLDNSLGRTPQMGWNSWNHFGCGVNESIVIGTADAMMDRGLSKVGYRYVNIDDCWQLSRNATGYIQPDPETFPNIQALVDYVHSLDLLFGLYSSAGTYTCQKRPGSLGYETEDASSYASWGVDYLKLDHCHNAGIDPKIRYPIMRDALNKTGRPIFYSLCESGHENPALWAPSVGNSWRTTPDIQDNWESMISRIHLNDRWWAYAGPGGWNDPDMLEVGNGGMTVTEYITHFSLWCIAKAPLLIGCDVTKVEDEYLNILLNADAIAVNQDTLGAQGHVVAISESGNEEVWAGPLAKGDFAVILLNTGNKTAVVEGSFEDIGILSSKALVYDIWQHKQLGVVEGNVTAKVDSHGVAFYRLIPQ